MRPKTKEVNECACYSVVNSALFKGLNNIYDALNETNKKADVKDCRNISHNSGQPDWQMSIDTFNRLFVPINFNFNPRRPEIIFGLVLSMESFQSVKKSVNQTLFSV